MGLVFTGSLGSNLSTKSVYNNFKALVAGIGMEAIRMHDLRHTFAMLSLQMGVDIKTLQQELGHHTAAFTLDVYGHVSDAMLDGAGSIMQRYIDGWKARQ